MTIKEFEIVFENPEKRAFYSVGDILAGKVIISTDNGGQKNLKRLQIGFTGKAKNSWFEKRKHKKLFEITEEEEYLNFEAEITLDAGKKGQRSEYGFAYELAPGLPSSFNGVYGNISYAVTATLFRRHGSLEAAKTITKEFVLKGHVDLNAYPQASQPSEIKLTQPLLFQNGWLGMEASLEKSGFVPGEVVNFKSMLTNESNKNVNVSLQLIQETTYIAKDRRVSDIKVIGSKPGPVLKPHTTEPWDGGLLEIPSLPPSVLENCDIMAIQYRIGIEMEVPSPNINLEASIPIMIGTEKLIEKSSSEKTNSLPRSNEDEPLQDSESDNLTQNLDEKASLEIKPAGPRRFRPRQNRPQTTCLVFRKDRPRQKLPTPKPETWSKTVTNSDAPNATKKNLFDSLEDINPTDLHRYKESTEEVLALDMGADGKPCFAPTFLENTEADKPKFPDEYIRRRNGNDKGTDLSETTTSKPHPPKKPERNLSSRTDSQKDMPPFPGELAENNGTLGELERETIETQPPPYTDCCGKKNVKSKDAYPSVLVKKKGTLPYPKESNLAFPVPDFSFNTVVDGEARDSIGWNITRNTLSLKRANVAPGFVLPLPTVGWSADPPVS